MAGTRARDGQRAVVVGKSATAATGASAAALRCRRKFLRHFPGGFRDETYIDWERDYKWAAHERWELLAGPRDREDES